MISETIREMENVLQHIGEKLGVKAGDMPGLLTRIESLVATESRALRATVACPKHSYWGHSCPDCLADAERKLAAAVKACVAMADDGWLMHGVEGMSEAQQLVYGVIEPELARRGRASGGATT